MEKNEGTASFKPTKRFFVEMLTRDIDLEDAILDLLDNCLDGVSRSSKSKDDYKGFKAEINFNADGFSIVDNCGGIPREKARYAFRMGKPSDAPNENLATVGVYGIGMKRSIFKMGRYSEIITQHTKEEAFSITIDEAWLSEDDNWDIPMESTELEEFKSGTKIEVCQLHESVKERFESSSFRTSLINKIVYAYSYIISKGFSVKVNGQLINPAPVNMRYEDIQDNNGKAIQPYIYTGEIDGVDVKLIVGFYSEIPTEREQEAAKKQAKYDSKNAGWTIVCNDRIVVFKDKTELTGWGVDLPQFHTQFISISGIVYLTSNNPEKLPITTTKRGVDSASPVFLKIRKYIIEGTKLFIDYTNKWKGPDLIKASNSRLKSSKLDSPLDVIVKFQDQPSGWTNVRNKTTEKKFKPNLPLPKKSKKGEQIRFTRSSDDLEVVQDYLSLPDDISFSQVGEACFEYVLREAKR